MTGTFFVFMESIGRATRTALARPVYFLHAPQLRPILLPAELELEGPACKWNGEVNSVGEELREVDDAAIVGVRLQGVCLQETGGHRLERRLKLRAHRSNLSACRKTGCSVVGR